MRISKLSLAALFFLAACGGGGDDGDTPPGGVTNTPLAINADNYVAVATESVSAVSYVVDASEFFTGAQVSGARSPLDFARAQALKLPGRFALATPRFSGAVLTEVEACTGGGELRITLDDKNGNDDLDAGESITMVATNCVEFDSTVNGTIAMLVTRMTGDPYGDVYQMGLTMTLTQLSVAMQGSTAVGNGNMAMDMSMTGPHTGDMLLTFDAFTMSGTFGGVPYSRTMWDFHIADTYSLVNNAFHGSMEIRGVLGSSALDSKAVTLSTPVPMVIVGADEYPSSGQILATGAANSKVRMTAQPDAATVRIEVDANGDGSYETSTTKAWGELM